MIYSNSHTEILDADVVIWKRCVHIELTHHWHSPIHLTRPTALYVARAKNRRFHKLVSPPQSTSPPLPLSRENVGDTLGEWGVAYGQAWLRERGNTCSLEPPFERRRPHRGEHHRSLRVDGFSTQAACAKGERADEATPGGPPIHVEEILPMAADETPHSKLSLSLSASARSALATAASSSVAS